MAEQLDKELLRELNLQMAVARDTLILRRKVLNMRQYEVSKKAGVSDALVNIFENDGTNISFSKMERIARALGMKIVISVEEVKGPIPDLF